MAGTTTDVTAARPPRTEAQIENDLARAKRRLVANLDELVVEAHPKAVAHQVKEEARAFAETQFEQAKQQVKDEYGWRVDRFVVVGGAVLGVVTFLLVVRALTKRAHQS
jgi:hypothetical protein